jgi:hypothetical protein
MKDLNNDVTTVGWPLTGFSSNALTDLRPLRITGHGCEFIRRAVRTTYGHAIMEILVHIPLTPDVAGR